MMSNLIRTRRALTYTPSPTATPSLTTTPTTAATALAEMNHKLVNPIDPIGHPVPHTQASSTSSMALPVRARRTHRRPRTMNQMLLSRSTTDASAKKNTRGPCQQLKTGKVTWVTNGRIPIGYDKQHQAAPMAEQHSALAHDIGHVVRTFYPMRWKSWKAMSEETKNTVRNQLSISSIAFLMLFM
ncbi:uncharacterized protein LOC126583936 isoform X2 [Malus sylvestris]|uniref:uncharacterized protein LOC126583936 isoform X2 n=1 Tax=Malus sylvestris TaxID=3752 RepID=UPI0021AC8C53|nr:uncharacterized protein LOC126583936 isoform X2 [Malus sylvestris]